MKNAVILIHGAWHASWCFSKIAPKLSMNFNVFTPDLSGHGNNNIDFKNVNLRSYVDYVKDLVTNNNLEKVTLVGHSMGGIVISQVVEELGINKISKLIYISGFIPSNNCSLVDEERKSVKPSVALKISIDESESSISINNKADIKNLFYNCCSDDDSNYAISKFQKQPLKPFHDKVILGEKFRNIPKVYIECLRDNAIHINDQRRMSSKYDCKIHSIDTDHSPFFSEVDALVGIVKLECGFELI